MPKQRIPSYSRASKGRAYTKTNGQWINLGRYNSQQSKDRYDAVIGEWLAHGRTLRAAETKTVTVSQVLAAVWTHAKEYYAGSSELHKYKQLIGFVRKAYGRRPVEDFGPRALIAIRQTIVDKNRCRSQINGDTGRVRRIFKSGVQAELVALRRKSPLTISKTLISQRIERTSLSGFQPETFGRGGQLLETSSGRDVFVKDFPAVSYSYENQGVASNTLLAVAAITIREMVVALQERCQSRVVHQQQHLGDEKPRPSAASRPSEGVRCAEPAKPSCPRTFDDVQLHWLAVFRNRGCPAAMTAGEVFGGGDPVPRASTRAMSPGD